MQKIKIPEQESIEDGNVCARVKNVWRQSSGQKVNTQEFCKIIPLRLNNLTYSW